MLCPLHRLCPPTCRSSGWFPAVLMTPPEKRSAFAWALQTRFRSPLMFAPFSFRESALSRCARALLLCAQALLHRISLETRNARTCIIAQTHFRPLLCEVFLKPFFGQCDALLRLGPALQRLRRTLLFSARRALRSRLCDPNTLLPIFLL